MKQQLEKLLEKFVKLHPKYIDLSLNRITKLLNKLDNPHLKLPPIIHIAGTNGKGSVLSFIRHILMEKKYNTHAYISPHLKNFNERIIISNKTVSNKKLYKYCQYVKKINNNNPITFFEITTAVAFLIFSKEKADFLILETGLGGRLDATNVIKNSMIDIITPISLDHEEYLGSNLKAITNEKLGIIKSDSTVLISKQKKIVKSHIISRLKKNINNKIIYGNQYKIKNINLNTFILNYKNKNYKINRPKLLGLHQIENAAVAAVAALNLKEKGYKISNEIINKGIKNTHWPGRLEKTFFKNSIIYLDGAHNTAGAEKLTKYFINQNIKIWIIIGMLNNKNLNLFLKKIKPIIKGVIAINIPEIENSFASNQIALSCSKNKIKCIEKNNIIEANNFLIKDIKAKEILITGSLYLIGKVRNLFI